MVAQAAKQPDPLCRTQLRQEYWDRWWCRKRGGMAQHAFVSSNKVSHCYIVHCSCSYTREHWKCTRTTNTHVDAPLSVIASVTTSRTFPTNKKQSTDE